MAYQDQKIKEQIKQENEFFNQQSLFDAPMTILGTLKRKLSAPKVAKGQLNHFHAFAEAFFYPVMHLFRSPYLLSQPLLLAKALFTLSLILDAAQNHPAIAAFSQGTFKLLSNLSNPYLSQHEVTLNFVFLSSRLRMLDKPQIEELVDWIDH